MPKVPIKLPPWVTLAVSLVFGVLTYLNQQGTFGIGLPWHVLVTGGLATLASLGVAPLAHGALQNVLHLAYPQALMVSSLFATAAVGAATISMDLTLRSILVGVLTVLAGALVGPKSVPAPVPLAAVPTGDTLPSGPSTRSMLPPK